MTIRISMNILMNIYCQDDGSIPQLFNHYKAKKPIHVLLSELQADLEGGDSIPTPRFSEHNFRLKGSAFLCLKNMIG